MYSKPFAGSLSEMAASTLLEGYSPLPGVPQMRTVWAQIIEAKAKGEFGLPVKVRCYQARFARVYIGAASHEYSWSAIRSIAEKLALGKEHTFKISE